MADVIVYIDGFNLYYGALKRTPYKWLDLGRLCSTMLPNDNVLAINYYTARMNVCVERAMMERAQGNAVQHDRLSPRMAIGQDVCSVQQLLVPQPAHRAVVPVGLDYPQTERLLMQAVLDLSRDVATSALRVLVIISRLHAREPAIVDVHGERQPPGRVADDVNGPLRKVLAAAGFWLGVPLATRAIVHVASSQAD